MSALARLFGRVREQLAELSDAVAPNQAQRELDEDIRTSDAHIRDLRAALAELQARRFTSIERIDQTVAAITQREAQAVASLRAGQHGLAQDVAAEIVQLEHARDDERAFVAQLETRIAQLRHLVEDGENRLRRLQLQLDALRAAETVQRALETVAGRQGSAGLPQNAIESLLRARGQTAPREAGAGSEPPGNADLDARLRAAGIDERNARAQLVLDRLAQRVADTGAPSKRRGTQARTPKGSR